MKTIFLKIRLLFEAFIDNKRMFIHSGAINTRNDHEKYKSLISIMIHGIEKGLALPNPRAGFGESKIINIFNEIEIFKTKFDDNQFLSEAKSIFIKYFSLNKELGHINHVLLNKFEKLFSEIENIGDGGILSLSKKEIENATNFDYDKFVRTRFSIRDFSEVPVSKDIILKALEIARKTPSGCNKQGWRVYVYRDKEKVNSILKWQGGNNGFTQCIDTAILVTCSLKSYFYHERMSSLYVDGGLYAMNLIFAFHSLGIGTIPLMTAKTAFTRRKSSQSNTLYKEFGVRNCDVPIVIIGVGHLKETFNVAISTRKPISEYVTFFE